MSRNLGARRSFSGSGGAPRVKHLGCLVLGLRPSSVTMSISTTVDKVVLSKSQSYKLLLKTMYFYVKPVNGFFKGTGRWQDTGSSALWFDMTGSTREEVERKAKNVITGKAIVGTNMTLKKSIKYYSDGGLVVDLNPRSGAKCNPVAASHPDNKKFQDVVPVPKGKINTLLSSTGGERVDVRGVVTEVAPSQNKAIKVDVWIKDDSGDEILAELWGKTFVKEAVKLSPGMVLQLDCVGIKVSGTGKRTLTGEHFTDSEPAHSFMLISPKGPRSDELKKLGSEKANRISAAWSGSGFSRMDATGEMHPAQRSLPQSPSLGRLASGSILNDSLGSPGKPLRPLFATQRVRDLYGDFALFVLCVGAGPLLSVASA